MLLDADLLVPRSQTLCLRVVAAPGVFTVFYKNDDLQKGGFPIFPMQVLDPSLAGMTSIEVDMGANNMGRSFVSKGRFIRVHIEAGERAGRERRMYLLHQQLLKVLSQKRLVQVHCAIIRILWLDKENRYSVISFVVHRVFPFRKQRIVLLQKNRHSTQKCECFRLSNLL